VNILPQIAQRAQTKDSWGKGSAKADDADNAEKGSCNTARDYVVHPTAFSQLLTLYFVFLINSANIFVILGHK